ncbi:MAG: hypothetical protein HZA00_04915 [Nitrospinae bacterium]|nr:hypothetical protein [Nitrospinota bacterium]
MKKISIVAVIMYFMLMAGLTNVAFAEEGQQVGKDLYLILGYKAWLNEWQSGTTVYIPQAGANIQSFTSSAVAASIPSVTLIMFKDFFISSGYMVSPTYTFKSYSDTIKISSTPYTANYDYSATRTELDANVGYYVVPSRLGLTIGYKEVKQNYHLKQYGTGLVTSESDGTTTISGITFGIVGNSNITGNLNMYGNLSYSPMKAKYSGGGEDDNAVYVSSELGFGYRAGSNFTLSLGYKYQAIDTINNESGYGGQIGPDVTKGFIFGVNYIF